MTSRRLAAITGLLFAATLSLAAQQRDPKQYQQTLEQPDRLAALQVDKVIAALNLSPGLRVADVGAGSGVFTIPFARAVGAAGKVYAVDIDPGMLAIVTDKVKAAGLRNVQNVVAGDMESKIPEPVDLIFICDTMHHLPKQADYVKQFGALLRPGGRVVVIEFSPGHWPAGHESFTITPAQVDTWMSAAGFARAQTYDFLASNFFYVYRRQ